MPGWPTVVWWTSASTGTDGTIAGVTAAGSTAIDGDTEVDGMNVDDLGGWLLLPAMAEPHAHLDKALTADEVPNPKGDLHGAIDAWAWLPTRAGSPTPTPSSGPPGLWSCCWCTA